MNEIQTIIHDASLIESKIDYAFRNRALLVLAFVHCSYINEQRDLNEHNERLEFLGDSVLGLIVSEYLYSHLPNIPEGELSYLRSRLVDANSCVLYVNKLDVSSYLLLSKGERMNLGRGRDSILADLFEAIIGAIFLDGGYAAAKKFFFGHFGPEIESILQKPETNWKALLQDYCQKNQLPAPVYTVVEATGPDHSKVFKIAVRVKNGFEGEGSGPSKKAAQQAAAENAMGRL